MKHRHQPGYGDQGRILVILTQGLFFAVAVMIGNPGRATAEESKRHEFLQIRMGVPVRILVYATNESIANQASDAAFRRIRELDRILSDYDPDSELMKLCQRPAGQPVPVSPDLFKVLSAARKLSKRSDGAFDVTVGPVVKLWRVARRRKQLPNPERLQAAQALVDYRNIELDPRQRTVTLLKPEMQLDMGGIAKGYAADEALKTLAEQGLKQALVAVAGDIRVGEPPPGKTHWRVQVERRGNEDTPLEPIILQLKQQAVSTSGDTYQFVEIDGLRYSHIVNPKTGLGLTTPGSVTVIAPTGMRADGLASTISVLGPQAGIEFAEGIEGIEARISILDASGQPQVQTTSGWSRYLSSSADEVE